MAKKAAKSKAEIQPIIESAGSEPKINKAEAIRRTVADGITSPTKGSAHILESFGLDVSREYFSAAMSQAKKKEAAASTPEVTSKELEAERASVKASSASDSELLAAMEALKPMIAALGVDKVKRLADLLG